MMERRQARVSNLIILLLPWLLLALMLNIRLFPFIAPYEEPRWLLFVGALFVLTTISAYQLWFGIWQWQWRKQHFASYGLLFFLLALAIGILYSPNRVEALLRFTFWLSACAIFCASAYSTRYNPNYLNVFAWGTSLSCLTFSLHYWWLYVTEYGHSKYTSIAAGGKIIVFFSPIGHVNFTSDVLIILLPMLFWLLWSHRQVALLLINSISVVSILLILLIASSRGALGGLFIGMIVALLLSARHWRVSYIATLLHWKTIIVVISVLLTDVTQGNFKLIYLRHG